MPPKVSIGLPVYNGEATIRRALNSLRAQTFSDFEIVISDNASSDGTEAICRQYESQDSRIRYFRQADNIGAPANFKFVLEEASGLYFMWAAADDLRSPDFLEVNVSALDLNPSYSASTSPNCYEGEEGNPEKHVTFALTGSLANRYLGFMQNAWLTHGIFYSLMRAKHISECEELSRSYAAHDWSIDLYLLSRGDIGRVTAGLTVLGKNGVSAGSNAWRHFRNLPIENFLPLYQFSRYALGLMRDMKLSQWFRVFLYLAKLNVQAMRSNVRGELKYYVQGK